jgi:hypothetical protein
MKRWIERALNIQPGDLGRGILLFSCLFLITWTFREMVSGLPMSVVRKKYCGAASWTGANGCS